MTPGPALRKTQLPLGFKTAGINCGIRKYRPDLGVVISDCDATMVGVYTTNRAKAAHILYDKSILPSNNMRMIITNSGQANSATGKRGLEDNMAMVESCAKVFDVKSEQVASASTGVIGVPLNIEKITYNMPELQRRMTETAEAFATAIMTTDLVPKTVTTEVQLSQGSVRLTGICKGSGMIHPNMATMLGYFLTDLKMDIDTADQMLRVVTNDSFNMISVDGETSTNDSCFLMANGASGIELVTEHDREIFFEKLKEVAIFMAKSIAQDGEGASKLIEVNIDGLPEEEIARRAAKGIILSPLVKTAIHGEDPNWGRIYSRLGQDGIPAELLDQVDLKIQGVNIITQGEPQNFDYYAIRSSMSEDFVKIDILFNAGIHGATAWGCDLTKKYVDINTEYN